MKNFFFSAMFMFLMTSGLYFLFVTGFDTTNPKISLMGELTDHQQSEVLSTLRSRVDLADLADIKQELEAIDWVYRAFIARKWPDDLIIDVRIQRPIAYWNDDGYINRVGEVFVTELVVGGDLPQLYGPTGTSERVMNEYQQLNRVLFKSNRAIETLTLNERGAWMFQDHSGIHVLLGKENIHERLERSIDVLKAIKKQKSSLRPVRIDARYNNGVAVAWEPEKLELAKNFKLQGDVSL